MKNFTALLSGTLFGAGLALAQMTNPAKVLAFLDVTGAWDPSLAFVMGAALLVFAIAVRLEGRLRRTDGKEADPSRRTRSEPKASEERAPADGAPTWAPTATRIDRRLLAGATLFGVGWGLAGFCPGPAVASLVTGSVGPVWFVLSMLVGMGLYRIVDAAPRRVLPSTALLLAVLLGCGSPSDGAGDISPQDLLERAASGLLVLDVRTPGEFLEGRVPGAVNIPHDQLAARLDEVDAARDTGVAVYCESGRRAGTAASILSDEGFAEVLLVDGHMSEWRTSGRPTETGPRPAR